VESILPRNFENILRKIEIISAGKREQDFAIKMEIIQARKIERFPIKKDGKHYPRENLDGKHLFMTHIILALYDVP
jgi:hypothetical protein